MANLKTAGPSFQEVSLVSWVNVLFNFVFAIFYLLPCDMRCK